MAASKEEFLEITSTDVISEIDRLRDISFYGIPDEVRGKVWALLLAHLKLLGEDSGLHPLGNNLDPNSVDQEDKVTVYDDILVDHEVVRVLKSEISRYLERTKKVFAIAPHHTVYLTKPTKLRGKLLSMVHQYLNSAPGAWHMHHAALVHVAAPFALVFRKESEATSSFRLLMRALDAHFGPSNGWKTLGRFLMLFRSRLPELFTHFEEEDLESGDWASSWLQYLLCRV